MNKIIPTCFVVVSSALFGGCNTVDNMAVDNPDYINYTVSNTGYDTYTPYYWNTSYDYSPGYGYTYWGNGYKGRGGYSTSDYNGQWRNYHSGYYRDGSVRSGRVAQGHGGGHRGGYHR